MIWLIYCAFPGWGALLNSWAKKEEYKKIFATSIGLFLLNLALQIYLIWLVLFSEPWDTNGIVTLVACFLLPLFPLVVTVPIYLVLGKIAVKKGAWSEY